MDIQSVMKALFEERLQSIVNNRNFSVRESDDVKEYYRRKEVLLEKRKAEVVKVTANIKPLSWHEELSGTFIEYCIHFKYLIKQIDMFYLEEEEQYRKALLHNNVISYDIPNESREMLTPSELVKENTDSRNPFLYNRLQAVKYAELYWQVKNDAFPYYQNNCTNFVSQCLYAGGAPMTKYGDKRNGWWYTNNHCSLSWSTSHSLKWHVLGANKGLRAKEVTSQKELLLGDVIFYDFQGDGRWDHVTIITAKDKNGEPLVNANTFNCRKRYWSYEDSTAYTPSIKYKFFRIIDDNDAEKEKN